MFLPCSKGIKNMQWARHTPSPPPPPPPRKDQFEDITHLDVHLCAMLLKLEDKIATHHYIIIIHVLSSSSCVFLRATEDATRCPIFKLSLG